MQTVYSVCVLALIAALLSPLPTYAFDPRSYRQMPALSEIPSPNLSAEQVKERCLQAFNKSYKGARAQDTPNTDRQYWPGVMFVKFVTTGSVATGPRLKRPVCEVQYSWQTKFSSGSALTAYFDGRWLLGSEFIFEWTGHALTYTRYIKDGRRSFGTFEPE